MNGWEKAMGISAKIWPVTDAEIGACSGDPGKVEAMFHRYSLHSHDPANARGHAYIHGARELGPLLDRFAAAGLGVHRVEGTLDTCYAILAARVSSVHMNQARDPCHLLRVSNLRACHSAR